MRCLYCGKHLALLRKLTGGGEFCSDSHRDKYHEEYNKLAVSRLLQAQARPEEAKKAVSKKKAAAAHPPPVAPPVVAPPVVAPVAVAVAAVEVAPEPEPEYQEANSFADLPSEPEADEFELVEYVKEFKLQPVLPVAVPFEFLSMEHEPVPAADGPVFSSSLETSYQATATFHFDGGGDFLIDYPASRPWVAEPIDTATALIAETTPDLQSSQTVCLGAALAEAGAITDHFMPGACACQFEPVTVSVVPTEFAAARPVLAAVITLNGFTPSAPEPGTVGLVGLNLVPLYPEDGALEIVESLEFRSLLEVQSSFDSGLKQLNEDGNPEGEPAAAESPAGVSLSSESSPSEFMPSESLPIESLPIESFPIESAADEIPVSETIVQPLNGMHVPHAEPAEVTPRKVLEVLSKIHAGDVVAPSAAPDKVEARAQAAEVTEPAVPSRGVLRTLTIPVLIPSAAALMSGFPALPVEIQPRPLPYSPLPLRPKMAVGNALGPRAVRNGGQNGSAPRKAPDASKTMPRSMLHLEVAGTESEVETPTLLGRIGGLFGKKHKNH